LSRHIYSFYPNVKFLSSQYLGDSLYNTFYQVCDYCREYKKMHTVNQPIYYNKGARRRFISYCIDCKNAVFENGTLYVADSKYGAYYEILDAIKNSTAEETISFEDAVMTAFNRTQNVSEDGCGAEPGVSMLKRYLGCYRIADNNLSFEDKRLLEFRYKLQHEEPRVKVVNSGEDENDNLLLSWNRDFIEERY
jgi:hypothetical protein